MIKQLAQAPTSPAVTRAARPGALLAVCALCGGAGASTLSYLVGAWTADAEKEPVLVCDGGEPTAGLSAYAGLESLHSLDELAIGIDAGRITSDGLFAVPRAGLRLIAAGPRADGRVDSDATARLLRDARAEHRLTVVDCGRLASIAGRLALHEASHVAWVMPATASGVLRARRVLAVQELASGRREIVLARADPGGRQAPMAELTALAAAREAPLVLMPHVPDLGEHSCEEGLDAAQVSLHAIESLLRR